MPAVRSYSVYVINLDHKVLSHKKFRRVNPGYLQGEPCVYVGQTAKTPQERYDQHKRGGPKSNKYVFEYGDHLREQDYKSYNPISTRKEAENMEIYLTLTLRKKGYAVWSN